MANMPSKTKRAVTMRFDRAWVERVQEVAKGREETMTDLVVRAVSAELERLAAEWPPVERA